MVKEVSEEQITSETSSSAFCHFKDCREIGEEVIAENGKNIWYCKDHYFTVRQEEIALNKQKSEDYEKTSLCNKTTKRLILLSFIVFMIMYAVYSLTNWVSEQDV